MTKPKNFYGVLKYTQKHPDIIRDIENHEGRAHFTRCEEDGREFTLTLTVSDHGGFTLTLEDRSYRPTQLFSGNAFDLLEEREKPA